MGASTCSLLLVGDTSTLHFERSLGGAEYVFLPASKPSLGSSSPKGHSLAVRDKHCGDAVQKKTVTSLRVEVATGYRRAP